MRTMIAAVLAVSSLRNASAQRPSAQPTDRAARATLSVTAALVSADLAVKPVPLLQLRLISSQDTTRFIDFRTGLDGKATQLASVGTYRLRASKPVHMGDSTYSWDVPVTLTPSDNAIELTNANAVSARDTTSTREASQLTPRDIYLRSQAGVFRVEAGLGHGSGFLIEDLDGIVVTNDHVVVDATSASVYVDSVTRLPAVVVARDREADLALLRVPLELCNSCTRLKLSRPASPTALAEMGESVLAIGFPLNQDKTLTTGIASSVRDGAIISDVNINHGNSGGPLLNLRGEVIGVNAFGDFTNQGGPGISGAIAITRLFPLLESTSSLQAAPEPVVLPPMPRGAVPASLVKQIADTAQAKAYKDLVGISAGKFEVSLGTPALQQIIRRLYDEEVSKDRKKREARAGLSSDERYSELKQVRDWFQYVGQESAPVVTVEVTPKVGETFWSALGRGLQAYSYGAAVSPAKMKFKGDVRGVRFYRNGTEVLPVRGGHGPQSFRVDNRWVELKDVADMGYYVMTPEVFSPDSNGTPPQVTIVVQDLKNPKDLSSVTLKPEAAARIWNEFVPFIRSTRPSEPTAWADPRRQPADAGLQCEPETGHCTPTRRPE